jgi:HK97 family phage major capsid protein
MERIDELMQQRAALVTEQRRILDRAEGENRGLTGEETAEYERMDSEFATLETRIERLKDQRERQRSLAEAEAKRGGVFDPNRDGDPNASEAQRAYSAAFDRYLRHGMQELTDGERALLRKGFATADEDGGEARDLSAGVVANGGYTVPQGFYNKLVNKLELVSNVRVAGATRLETASGNPLPIPKVTAHAAASWAAELSTLAAADDTFAQTILNAYKAVKLIKVSLELLEDSGVNIEDYIASEIGRAIGRLEGDAFATGASGSTTTPEGVINKATIGVTTAAAGGLVYTSDEFVDMVYSLTRPYRDGATWLMSDGLMKLARKLKDTTGQYLWQPAYTKGEQESLLGYPVYVEPTYANPGSAVLTATFGNHSGYFIRDVGNFRLFRLNERYMDTGEVGFLGWHRTDGDLIDTNAVRSFKSAT